MRTKRLACLTSRDGGGRGLSTGVAGSSAALSPALVLLLKEYILGDNFLSTGDGRSEPSLLSWPIRNGCCPSRPFWCGSRLLLWTRCPFMKRNLEGIVPESRERSQLGLGVLGRRLPPHPRPWAPLCCLFHPLLNFTSAPATGLQACPAQWAGLSSSRGAHM